MAKKPKSTQSLAEVGRPTKLTMPIVKKLEEAFHNDLTIEEACMYAGITRQTYYNWLDENQLFFDKMTEARSGLAIKAKSNVATAIRQGDSQLSFRWLERRDPAFKPKAEVDNNLGLQQTRDKLKEFMDERSDSPDDGSAESTAKDAGSEGGDLAESPQDIS